MTESFLAGSAPQNTFISASLRFAESISRFKLGQERSAPVDQLSDKVVEKFGTAVSQVLRNPDNRQLAKAYVRTLVSKIEVGEKQIRISGPKDGIAYQAMPYAVSGELVPAFAQEWR
ncbi:hypothetical protein, partial [Hyphomonas pacifica]|uniref:hypothetical protein n=1 Tax=Hyphomonas pacifica TaxID=1280941 RepID=UPI0011B93721